MPMMLRPNAIATPQARHIERGPAPPPTPMKERIQKVLSARGVGSRREVEGWIAEGRITVDGAAATPGQAIGPRSDVRLDGRKLRLHWDREMRAAALAYHRPAQEGLRAASAGTERSSIARLPRPPSGRWIPICPMGVGEGGLELFVNDGQLAAALMSRADELPAQFSVRLRGEFDEQRIDEVLAAGERDTELRGRIKQLECAGGEAANRWADVTGTGLRPRDLKRVFEACGLEANRILRTRLGLVSMDRSLARGCHRRLTDGELGALHDLAGVPRPAGAAAAARPRKARPGKRERAKPGSRGGPPRR